jgi:hypothetical protein
MIPDDATVGDFYYGCNRLYPSTSTATDATVTTADGCYVVWVNQAPPPGTLDTLTLEEPTATTEPPLEDFKAKKRARLRAQSLATCRQIMSEHNAEIIQPIDRQVTVVRRPTKRRSATGVRNWRRCA